MNSHAKRTPVTHKRNVTIAHIAVCSGSVRVCVYGSLYRGLGTTRRASMLDWGQSKNAWVMTLLDQYASIKHDVMELCPNLTRMKYLKVFFHEPPPAKKGIENQM